MSSGRDSVQKSVKASFLKLSLEDRSRVSYLINIRYFTILNNCCLEDRLHVAVRAKFDSPDTMVFEKILLQTYGMHLHKSGVL